MEILSKNHRKEDKAYKERKPTIHLVKKGKLVEAKPVFRPVTRVVKGKNKKEQETPATPTKHSKLSEIAPGRIRAEKYLAKKNKEEEVEELEEESDKSGPKRNIIKLAPGQIVVNKETFESQKVTIQKLFKFLDDGKKEMTEARREAVKEKH